MKCVHIFGTGRHKRQADITLLFQYMYEHVIVETLSGTFNAISGGNIYNMILRVNAATLRGLISFLCLI